MENAQVRSVWCVLFLLLLWNCSFLSACGVGKSSYTKKDYQPFRQFQQKPEEEEESAVASGPFHHKIKYGSKEFRTKLVRYVGTNVVFKDDEGTGADRYMTKRCRRALERLAQHVRVKWNNKVKLRVIEAWDEDGEHYARSLHYEGRAIDITTSDRDRGKYGDLASLAYFKAEFDWVTYVDGHVHISCKKDDAVDERNSCFPSHGTVLLESGLKKPMSSLQIGDRILTMSSSGKPVFSPVIMFMDAKPEAVINGYVVIESINPARRIELTGKHLIFASKDGVNFQTVFAEKTQPGDFIKVVRANNTGFASAQVVKVHLRQGKGAYAPLTEQGTVVVNGVIASCYALTEEQQTAHLSFLPWRLTYDVMKHFESTKPQTGLHWYVRVLRTINSVLRILPEV